MNIEACIAQAINTELDIVEVMPKLNEIPVELLDDCVNQFLDSTTDRLTGVILRYGGQYVEGRDAKGLDKLLRTAGIRFPKTMQLKLCQKIIELYDLDAWLEGWMNGHPVYSMRIVVDLSATVEA